MLNFVVLGPFRTVVLYVGKDSEKKTGLEDKSISDQVDLTRYEM